MFRLMIVDDEDNTREGIAESIHWREMGISDIEQADDGVNALSKAAAFEPDIILTDVRMPRMDGMELSFKLRKIHPECVIIFMSGYADTIYLKSAIQLKAVSYLEKPISLEELNKAIRDAVQICTENQKKNEIEQHFNSRITLLKNELTLLLLKPNMDGSFIEKQIHASGLTIPQNSVLVTILIRLYPNDACCSDDADVMKSRFEDELNKIVQSRGIFGISAFQEDSCLLVHLYAEVHKKHLFTLDKLKNICGDIAHYFESSFSYFIATGKTVHGVSNTHASYEAAMTALNKAFFEGYNCIVSYDEIGEPPFSFKANHIQDFKSCIEKKSHEQAVLYIRKLTSEVKCRHHTPRNTVKECYFRLMLDLCKTAENLQFSIINDFSDQKHVWEYFFQTNTLAELETSLVFYIDRFYKVLEERNSSNRTVNKVIAYIKENYRDETLSITRISDYIHLSPTYLCSLFKEKTGKTLNHYITEVRVEKSKELLLHTKYRISDVTTMVGLRDQGYFTKIFKKTTGISPKEFITNQSNCPQNGLSAKR